MLLVKHKKQDIMKKWVVFLLGSITGAILTIVILVIIGMSMNNSTMGGGTTNSYPGLVIFEQPAEEIKAPSFRVMQVISNNMALAHAGENKYGEVWYNGMLVLLTGDEGTYFYDDQIVEVPKRKIARHIGTYQYETKSEIRKTVPVVKILDK